MGDGRCLRGRGPARLRHGRARAGRRRSTPPRARRSADLVQGQLAASLRCVEERVVTENSGGKRSQRLECFVLHDKSWTIERPPLEGDLAISLELPAEAPATDLGRHPPRYWELELAAETPGIDYHAVFLLPVY